MHLCNDSRRVGTVIEIAFDVLQNATNKDFRLLLDSLQIRDGVLLSAVGKRDVAMTEAVALR